MSAATCKGTRADGNPCGATPTASGYCFAHDAALQESTANGRSRGGKNRSRAVRARKAMGASQEQVLKFVEAGLAGVYKGTLTPQQGSAIASLAGAWVKLHEHGELTL